jgi:hypothetical protein
VKYKGSSLSDIEIPFPISRVIRKTIPIWKIKLESGYSDDAEAAEYDRESIKFNTKEIERGEPIKRPVVVDEGHGGQYVLADGWHRIMALKNLGVHDVEVDVVYE